MAFAADCILMVESISTSKGLGSPTRTSQHSQCLVVMSSGLCRSLRCNAVVRLPLISSGHTFDQQANHHLDKRGSRQTLQRRCDGLPRAASNNHKRKSNASPKSAMKDMGRQRIIRQAVASEVDRRVSEPLDCANVRIILVEPRGALNVGMVARSMANFGLSQLVLVNPQGEAADYKGQEARRMACHATSVLDEAVVVLNLAEALRGVTRTVATSARQRTPPAPPLEMLGRELPPGGGCLGWLLENDGGASAIVFGREDSGLTNEELSFAQRTLKIPSNPACSSLNLSHAVAVVCYELSREALTPESSERTTRVQYDVDSATAPSDDVSGHVDGTAGTGAGPSPDGSGELMSNKFGLETSAEPFETESRSGRSAHSAAENISRPGANERNFRSTAGGGFDAVAGHAETSSRVASTATGSSHATGSSQAAGSPHATGSSQATGSSEEEASSSGVQSKGPVEEVDAGKPPGWRRMRRLDRAQGVLDLADGADVEDTLMQADALLQKMGFFKGGSRGAKLPKLRQLLLRASPTNTEVALLRAILRRMDWYLTKALGSDQQEPR